MAIEIEAMSGLEKQFYAAAEEQDVKPELVKRALTTQSHTHKVMRGASVVAVGTRTRRGLDPADIPTVVKGGERVEIRSSDYLQSSEAARYTQRSSRVLALGMAGKLAVLGIPMDGAKTDWVVAEEVAADPEYLADVMWELERELAIKNLLGPFADVPAPDAGTNPWLMEALTERYRRDVPDDPYWAGSHTGKPLQESDPEGGVVGRDAATGRGLRLSLEQYLRHTNHLEEARGELFMAIGFGNVGAGAATELQEHLGMHLYAACDATTVVQAKDPARPLVIGKSIYYDEVKRGVGWVDEDIANVRKRLPADDPQYRQQADELLALEGVKVGLVASLGNEVHPENVDSTTPEIILEGSNNGVNDEALPRLTERRIVVLDYRVANANGVAVSGKEHEQNVTGRLITLEEVEEYSNQIMAAAWASVFAEAAKTNHDRGIYHLPAAVTRLALAEMVYRDEIGGLTLPYDPRRTQG